MKDIQVLAREYGEARIIVILAVLAVIPVAGVGQNPDSLDVKDKLIYHLEGAYSPSSIAGTALYAGALQVLDTPKEWGQGTQGYGKRFTSTMAWAGIYGTLAFGLDTTLHQDPRYFASKETGFWRRTGHALRGTLLTRKDNGGETFATWRFGAAYGSAYLSNQWYPDRLNTVKYDLIEGTLTIGFGFARNLGSEFWPDIKRKLRRNR